MLNFLVFCLTVSRQSVFATSESLNSLFSSFLSSFSFDVNTRGESNSPRFYNFCVLCVKRPLPYRSKSFITNTDMISSVVEPEPRFFLAGAGADLKF